MFGILLGLSLSLLPDQYAVCQLEPAAPVPQWSSSGPFTSVTRTSDELSIVCLKSQVPKGVRTEGPWIVYKVEGPLDFGLTGILASVANPLADAKVSIFAISTFDTDYILVKAENLEKSLSALRNAGFVIK